MSCRKPSARGLESGPHGFPPRSPGLPPGRRVRGAGPGQSYLVHTYTENDGLPSSMVYDLAQAPDGLMWFATRSGIAAYDGRTWRLFGAAEGLAGDVYSHVAVDERGTVWALARSPRASVSRFDDGRWSLLPFPPLSAETGGATVFAVSRPGGEIRVAIGTLAGGLLVFDGRAGLPRRFRKTGPARPSPASPPITAASSWRRAPGWSASRRERRRR